MPYATGDAASLDNDARVLCASLDRLSGDSSRPPRDLPAAGAKGDAGEALGLVDFETQHS